MLFVVVRPEDAERGLEACRGKMFLGAEMDLQYWQGWFTACIQNGRCSDLMGTALDSRSNGPG